MRTYYLDDEPSRRVAPGTVKKSPWAQEEDELLAQMVAVHGAKKWASISKMILGRTGKQCRERWLNHLNPDVKKDPFTPDEDAVIMQLVRSMGTKWAHIAKHLPGRTDNAIKNRYNSTLRKLLHKERGRTGSVSSGSDMEAQAFAVQDSPMMPTFVANAPVPMPGYDDSVCEVVASPPRDGCSDELPDHVTWMSRMDQLPPSNYDTPLEEWSMMQQIVDTPATPFSLSDKPVVPSVVSEDTLSNATADYEPSPADIASELPQTIDVGDGQVVHVELDAGANLDTILATQNVEHCIVALKLQSPVPHHNHNHHYNNNNNGYSRQGSDHVTSPLPPLPICQEYRLICALVGRKSK